MKKVLLLLFFCTLFTDFLMAQGGWAVCNSPVFGDRVDDVFMANTQTGYAVCGDGQIVKTSDGGANWIKLLQDTNIYCRSVEFVSPLKGFVGGFQKHYGYNKNTLRKTIDGGTTWTDLTALIDTAAHDSLRGICGLCAADSNTIYGCGNYFQDSAYIVKSSDGGNTWSFIDMHTYAIHLIDMFFLNKDTGFATGTGPLPFETAIVLYTQDGGQNWAYKFQDTIASEYVWKIYHLSDKIYFGVIENETILPSRIIKSTDGGMTWAAHQVTPTCEYIEGIGFIDSLKGWAGGWGNSTYESNDGGITWSPVAVCPWLNRFYKINDTLAFASGNSIWKYNSLMTGVKPVPIKNVSPYVALNCYPNPVNETLNIDVSLSITTHAMVVLFDGNGIRVKTIDNSDKPRGKFQYRLDLKYLPAGIYYLMLKTNEDKRIQKISVIN